MRRTGLLTAVRHRIGGFFALEDDWERPGGLGPADLVTGALTLLVAGVGMELYRDAGALEHTAAPLWLQWVAVVSGAVLVIGRRRWPLTVAALAAGHMVVVGVLIPEVMSQFALQAVYFVAYFSAVAWGRHRRETVLGVAGLIALMFVWLAWQFALGSGIDDVRVMLGEDADQRFGPIPPVTAFIMLTALINVVYFGGAVVAGQLAWRSARQQARLAEQAERLDAQAGELHRRAVVDERLRIARELHDVVAHHVSVIGVQAAAARRVLGRAPEQAATPIHRIEDARTALGEIEQSSREAVGQMRGLLGTLRADGTGGDADATREAEAGLDGLPDLVAGACGPGLTVTYCLVETPRGAARTVPAPLAHSLYRSVQEALANVQRHSTARRAGVVLRVDRACGSPHVEVEVTDDGRPRSGTSGSGLGQLGIRERAASHRGLVEIGPRVTGGYRVRVRLPLTPAAAERTA